MRYLLILFPLLSQMALCQVIDCDHPVYGKGYLPEFRGGTGQLAKFIRRHLKYPKIADEQGLYGSVRVKFRVSNNAEIDSVQIEKGLGYDCDEETIRLVKLTSGKWQPGRANGKKRSSFLTYDIKFELP